MNTKKVISILSNGVHIPPSICQMTYKAFNGIYEKFLADGYGLEEAYHAIEQCHKMIFGRPRYSSYDSFRTVRNRKLKN